MDFSNTISMLTLSIFRFLIFVVFTFKTSKQKNVDRSVKIVSIIGFILLDFLSSTYLYNLGYWALNTIFALLYFVYASMFCANHVIENIVLAFTYYITYWFTTYTFDTIILTGLSQYLRIPNALSEYLSTIVVLLISFIVINGILPRIIKFYDAVLNIRDFLLIMIFCLTGFFSLFFYTTPIMLLVAALSDIAIIVTFSDTKIIRQEEREKKLLIERNKFLEDQDKLIRSQAKEKYKSYQRSIKAEEQLRRINHDLIHHFNYLLDCKNLPQKAVDYINNLKGEVTESSNYFDTGSSIIDLILEEKCKLAEANGIKFKVMGDLSDGVEVDPASLSLILGNLLNNAFECVSTLDKNKYKVIDICFYQEPKKQFYLKVLNSATDNINIVNDEIKTSKINIKELHEISLKSVKQEVNKYNGDMIISAKDDMFSVEIIIPTK